MPIEQRVISGPKIGAKIGGGSSAAPTPPPAEEKKKRGLSKKLLIVVVAVVVLLGAAAAAYFLVFAKGGAEPVEPPPEPGEVVTVDPISLNLADGHYLRLGLALQVTADAHESPDPSKALDAAIALFSGRSIAEVSDPAVREQLTSELAHHLEELYEGEVMDVYLTNYVTQ
ncbi:flagellar basal body-associated FliL family protein [Cellulomonas fimi]|uniref:Flagellar protein FliL n=1 Tax=Cellulomonas fimi (strain ATCC 484 / DSM 20113 / JCM 1341 / CCUG 24087 / LMG 16345 / NBRC 15513 / NCIMB 8980 / NCTC 7547 / NRS-133) TaxID=590998 RepID=F4GYV7_CELFA|nr:flagellar basal body-associated FliL family protein [Cellulomonas fimi]AEE44826.1 flagellar basal body-associated protein FliL [Cellulomonas fimi ATCC 484]NNH08359.1 flagellar basal body-associated FliL family protein [Cellulomonas fimi]VEH27403.1 flagellar basal body-associated protein FliL [Cellulomonas fimi]